MLNKLRYFISQATRSFFRNGLMSTTSVFTVMCCLFILGLFLSVSINVNYIAEQVEEQCEIQAFIDETLDPSEFGFIEDDILEIENVSDAELFTRGDALVYMRDLFGDEADALDGFEDDNPFRDSFKITVKDLRDVDAVVDALEDVDGIASIEVKQSMLDSIMSVTKAIKSASGWIMVLLCLISIFIISNTIKLAVYARRKEIGVMKFVGATNWFIRWPFVIEGIIIGLIGGIIAFGLISWGYRFVIAEFEQMHFDMFRLKSYAEIWGVLLSSFMLIGTFIGAIGSGISISRHLDV